MISISIIFDQFGHPNQPFWHQLYLSLLKRNQFKIKVFSQKFHKVPRKPFYHLKSQTILKRVLALILYPFRFFIVPVSFREYISSPELSIDQNNTVHILNAQQFPGISKMIKGKSVICSFRGYETLVRPNEDEMWKQTLNEIYSESKVLHFVCDYIKNYAIEHYNAPTEKCIVIHRSVDSDFFKPNHKTFEHGARINFCSIGRLTWQKGYKYSLRALADLKKEKLDFVYFIIGDGPDKSDLKKIIMELDLSNNVILCGQKNREEIKDYLLITDIYLQPSVNEALPNSILEASSMALPIVASNAGGIPEAIIDGETGIVTEVKNHELIKHGINTMLSSTELRAEYGNKARKFMKKEFSLNNELDKWTECYTTLDLKAV